MEDKLIINHPEDSGAVGSGSEINNEGKALTVNNNEAFGVVETQNFSVFAPGYVNRKTGQTVLQTRPYKITNLIGIQKFVTGTWAKNVTEQLRQIIDKAIANEFKKKNFFFCTFSGIFRYRRATELVQHSGLMVFDFDEPDIRKAWPDMDIEEAIQRLRQILLDDKVFETELLFRSPGGKGVKWVTYVGDMQGMKHDKYFRHVSKYLYNTYHIQVDESGKDVCRACFLPYDPDCYINPSLIKIN